MKLRSKDYSHITPLIVGQAAVIVSFDGTDGLILRGAVRVSTETVGVDYYDNAPLLAPFEAPSVGSARHQHHPAIDLGANIDWNYLQLDGVGGFEAAATGTSTTFSFGDLPNAVGARFAPGTFLPTAAQVGILPSALSLPSGTTRFRLVDLAWDY